MERIGEILKRKRPGSPGANTDESSAAEAPPASAQCPQCGGAGFVHPRLPSGEPDYTRAEPCTCVLQERDKERRGRLERGSGLGPLFRLTFEALDPRGRRGDPAAFAAALEACRAFAQEPKGWLVLSGASGTGKTHLAAAIASHRLQRGEPVRFIGVAELLDHLRATFSPSSPVSYDQLFQEVKTVLLLVLDDLGGHATTPWAEEKLLQIVDYRYQSRLPTVITTRLSLERLEEPLRRRLEDRELCQVFVLGAEPAPLLGEDILELPTLRRMTFETFDQRLSLPPEVRQNLNQAYRQARDFAEKPADWLVFLGTSGCGKTHLAAAIAHYRRHLGQPVLFQVVPELLDYLRSTFNPESPVPYDEAFERVKKHPLLILDDLGHHSASPWALDKLYQLVNYRYNARLPTVITTSLTLEEIADRLGDRFASRIGDQALSLVWQILAPDYRIDRKERRRQ